MEKIIKADSEKKRCPKCKEVKLLGSHNFGLVNRLLKRFDCYCKSCRKNYKKEEYKRNSRTYERYRTEYKEKRREDESKRRRTDIFFVINNRIRCLIFQSLKRGKGGKKWESLLGYSAMDLKKHLESKFTEGMTWERFMNGEIHIDHKTPVSAFNFTGTEDIDFKRCWAITNLQPLWSKENLRKHNRIDEPFQPALEIK